MVRAALVATVGRAASARMDPFARKGPSSLSTLPSRDSLIALASPTDRERQEDLFATNDPSFPICLPTCRVALAAEVRSARSDLTRLPIPFILPGLETLPGPLLPNLRAEPK